MTAGKRAWLHAMVAAAQFEDGSLVIEDDTLSVNGGSTVNLLVKLGAEPRSDVTVALSETSALISLGVASLTFTRDNWDTYQSVVVTAGGNRQEIELPASTKIATFVEWLNNTTPLPEIVSGLRPSGADRYFRWVRAYADGQVQLRILAFANAFESAGNDLSSAFEQSGSVSVVAGSDSLTAALAGADATEPYQWTPSNSGEVTAFYNAVANGATATLTLRDYVPADATIALSASGPAEYTGVTGSATVSVG